MRVKEEKLRSPLGERAASKTGGELEERRWGR